MYPLAVNTLLALLWTACGFAFLKAPQICASRLGYRELSPEALVDIRASFGGVCLAAGLGSLALAFSERLEAALWLHAVLLAGYAGGRALGLSLLKGSSPGHSRWLALEFALLLLVVTALTSLPGDSR